MRIEVRVDLSAPRRWHLTLKETLESRSSQAVVRIRPVGTEEHLPGSVAALLALEKLVLSRSRPTLVDPVSIDGELLPPADFQPDVIIDCSGGSACPPNGGAPLRLRPLYDDDSSETGLMASLLAGHIPEIALEDLATGAILATGRPSMEAARGLTGAADGVVSRVITLVEQVLLSPRHQAPSVAPGPIVRDKRTRGPVAFAMHSLARNCARAIYRLCFHSPHWRVGWRWHDGPGVSDRGDLGGPPWQVLRDPGRRFFADPFPVTWQGRTFVFFEDLDHRVGKGVISAIEMTSEGPRGDPVTVVTEPWHLSYPFLIEHEGVLWMVPEASLSGAVPLYRCLEFPHRWERAGSLLEKIEAADCTIFQHAGRFWMTGVVRPGVGGYSDILAIYHAADLAGPWEEHERRPVLVDISAARPGGRVIHRGGELLRPVQDCTQGYGRALSLARIDRLTPSEFSQTILHRLGPGPLWPGSRLHTLNRAGPLECIDGTTYNPRLHALRELADARMTPGRPSAMLASA